MIDKDEYPQTAEIERRCVAILADLWHAPDHGDATGCSTTGSSEACMLAGMALKRRWEQGPRPAGDPHVGKPNLVMGANVQVCWEKFCRYWEVEPRLVPMEGERFHLDAAGGGQPLRREHHRRRRRSSARPSTAATSRSPRSPRRWTRWPPTAARTCRCTWTAPPAG